MTGFPSVFDPERVGSWPAVACAGGGYVWDAVLEYRVWCHPEEGDDYYEPFASYDQAMEYSESHPDAGQPLALVLQVEYIDEPEPGDYRHVREERITEWPVQLLARPRRDEDTLVKFFAPNAPTNRLDIIRGLADWPD